MPRGRAVRGVRAAREALTGDARRRARDRAAVRRRAGRVRAHRRAPRLLARAAVALATSTRAGDAGVPVHAVGKVDDLFAGRGIDATHPGATNAAALAAIDELLDGLERGPRRSRT